MMTCTIVEGSCYKKKHHCVSVTQLRIDLMHVFIIALSLLYSYNKTEECELSSYLIGMEDSGDLVCTVSSQRQRLALMAMRFYLKRHDDDVQYSFHI